MKRSFDHMDIDQNDQNDHDINMTTTNKKAKRICFVIPSHCRNCHLNFVSRNQLFCHLYKFPSHQQEEKEEKEEKEEEKDDQLIDLINTFTNKFTLVSNQITSY